MSNKNADKKSLAILALPIGIAIGISVSMMFGSFAGNIPMGLCFGIIGGSLIGLLAFVIMHANSNKKDK